jgi:organic radical activating enzyme
MEENEIDIDSFPIKTKTSCQFKWTWSTIFLSAGTSSSCHRCQAWNVSSKKLMKNFHNHPGKMKDRKNMLNGKWPGNGCEYCKKIEDAGGKSERISYINDMQMSPKELRTNKKAISVTPRILEVYFTNLCNQKCVYCSPFFSSLIKQEIDKYGPLEEEYNLDGYLPTVNYEELKETFWEWMEENSRDLYFFQILGGEPLYQKEFEECLEFFERHSHPNTKWKIFSNLNHQKNKFQNKIDRISKLIQDKKLKAFEIVCSMDCWGPQSEFVRHGTNLEKWEENFNILLNDEFVEISVHSTITPITLPTMSDFYSKILEWKNKKEINYGWNVVANPTFMSPDIMGVYVKPFFDELLKIIPKEENKNYLDGFHNQVINHEFDRLSFIKLINYLDKIDARRGTNWRSLFPYLVDIIEKEKIN